MRAYKMPLYNQSLLYTTGLIVCCSVFSVVVTTTILNIITLAVVGV